MAYIATSRKICSIGLAGRPACEPASPIFWSLKEPSLMLQSHIIDIDGAFVGAAVRLDTGYRFIATDMKLDDLDGSIWPTLADVQRLARRVYLGGRAASLRAH